MLDLFIGYLLVIIALFSTNLGLFFGNLNKRVIFYSIFSSIILFFILGISNFFAFELINYFSYIFLIVSGINFTVFIYYSRDSRIRLANSILLIFQIYL